MSLAFTQQKNLYAWKGRLFLNTGQIAKINFTYLTMKIKKNRISEPTKSSAGVPLTRATSQGQRIETVYNLRH
jgi:hypothetical protein